MVYSSRLFTFWQAIGLRGNNGEILAGAATVSVKYGENPTIALSGAGTVLTLDCGESGVQLSSDRPTPLCVVVPPTTFTNGFTAEVYDTEHGIMDISTSKKQTVNRSKILKMPAKAFNPEIMEPLAVDLGLSVKWASFNVGATKLEEYGDYYAWGETAAKSSYSWPTYKWCNGSSSTMTKYCTKSDYGNECFTDNKTVLEPEDDVAHVKLGGSWRMPTIEEWEELADTENCTWNVTVKGSVFGFRGKK